MIRSTIRRSPGGRRGVVVALVAAVGLAGCSVVEDAREVVQPAPSTTVTPQGPPPGLERLARFYGQQLEWTDCAGAQCSRLTVPVDYDAPDGETIEIAVTRVPADRRSKRIGSLVVNPGGPGASGVDYAQAADFIVGSGVRDAYDVVGFDPRGVARSAPVDCVTDSGLDDYLGADPTPDTPAERTQFRSTAAAFGEACAKNGGAVVGHVSTVEAARDMDVLRGALGEKQLTYLGKSYGTLLGTTYAELFPKQVGRMVLDGVVAPDLTSDDIALGQAVGFERATRAWAAYCVDEGDCPLGDSVEQVMSGLRTFLRSVDATPLARTGDTAVPRLTEGWASIGIAQAMYDQGKWRFLVDAMADAVGGDGEALLQLANEYAQRDPGGTYSGNLLEVFSAVNCLDQSTSADLDARAAFAQRASQEAPTWGPFLAWGSLTCGVWPIEATGKARTISAAGAAPTVVIGTTRDPATPYEWSVRLRDQLAAASLITFDGDGHTAYTRSNECVDDAVDAFYLEGTVPRDGLRC
ncbi:MAG: alpha/beta hydrolase [Dermatophilaceae bacterium]